MQRDQADRIEQRRGLEQALAGLQFGEGGRTRQDAGAIGLRGGGDRGGVERGRRQRHIEPGAQGADDRGQSARLGRAQQQEPGPLRKLGFQQARGIMIGQRVQGAGAQRGGGVARAAADASEYRVGPRRGRRAQQLAQCAGGIVRGHGARLHQESKLTPNKGVRSGRPRRAA